jgi:hypothetical protein
MFSAKERKFAETPKPKEDRNDVCPVTCFKTLGEYLQGLRGKELRILVAKLVSQDLSLLRKIQEQKKYIEDYAPSTILEEVLAVDRQSMKRTLTQSLQDDESLFYKEEDVARTERYFILFFFLISIEQPTLCQLLSPIARKQVLSAITMMSQTQ